MGEKRFSTILYVIVRDIVRRLASGGQDYHAAIVSFYHSKVYELLSDQKSGLWHSSSDLLLELYSEELQGKPVDVNWCV